MNSTLYKLLFFATAFVALAACAKDKSSEPIAPPTSNGGRIILSADLGNNFAVDISDEDNLKMLSIFQKGTDNDTPFTFDIEISKYQDKQMHLFLKRPDRSEIVELFTPVSITKTTSGQYRMSAVVDHVPTPPGVDLSQGDWYITGFWGGSDKNTTGDQYKHKVAEIAPQTPSQVGDKVDMDIPLGFPWTRITGKWTASGYLLQNLDLKIRPMGVLLSLMLENRTKYTANIRALDKEVVGFAFGGYFNASNATEQDLRKGLFPKFQKFSEENVNNESVEIFPKEIVLKSGEKSQMPVYIWMMPTETNPNSIHALSFTFISKKRTTMDQDLYHEDRFDTNGIGRFTDHYVIDLAFKQTPNNSTFYFRDIKIRSGLMITEYFINRHRIDVNIDDSYWIYAKEPNFLGYVELYNPNLDPLILKHYALARISNLRRVYYDAYNGGRARPNYGFFHPFAMERYNEWNSAQTDRPKGTADRYADAKTQSHKALLLSLQLKNGQKSSFQPNSLGFSSHLETQKGVQPRLEADASNDERIEHVRFLKPAGGISGEAKLSGGKTMLLLGNGFIERGDPANIPAYSYYYPQRGWTGNLYPYHKLSGTDWSKIMNDPQCEIIVAVDNYRDRNAYPIYADAGVLNLNWSDALILIQKHPKDSRRRRVVDATSTHPFSRKNNWTEFVKKVTLVEENDIGYAHFRVRTVAQRLPEFYNFTEAQWHPVRFGTPDYWNNGTQYPTDAPIPTKVSPGRRSTDPTRQ